MTTIGRLRIMVQRPRQILRTSPHSTAWRRRIGERTTSKALWPVMTRRSDLAPKTLRRRNEAIADYQRALTLNPDASARRLIGLRLLGLNSAPGRRQN